MVDSVIFSFELACTLFRICASVPGTIWVNIEDTNPTIRTASSYDKNKVRSTRHIDWPFEKGTRHESTLSPKQIHIRLPFVPKQFHIPFRSFKKDALHLGPQISLGFNAAGTTYFPCINFLASIAFD